MRLAMRISCALAVIGLASMLSAPAYSATLTVKTDKGKVAGKTINDGKVNAFMGIPYAAPPVGDLRWKATQPAAKWKGVRDATSYGNHCVGRESPDMVFRTPVPARTASTSTSLRPPHPWPRASCPSCSGFMAAATPGAPASEPRHNGDFFPLKGVVLVTINYRLGLFGFLATRIWPKRLTASPATTASSTWLPHSNGSIAT